MKHIYFLLALLLCTQLAAQDANNLNINSQIQNVTQLNSTQLDFSPTYYKNGIVFVSNRTTDLTAVKGNRKDQKINDHFMGLYYAEKDAASNNLKSPEAFSTNITGKFHEGPLCFSQDGNLLFFTKNNIKKGAKSRKDKKRRYLKIYTAQKSGTDWTNITELPFNTEEFEECHPAVSADGKTLIFSSNRPGGLGGMDLYRSELINNQWSIPQNLGNQVNTAQNEVFPFLHNDGQLFFASNGWNGLGGLDIFSTKMDTNNSVEPTNIGAPINSDKDDFGLIVNKDKTEGYFSSARQNGIGKDDIYKVNFQTDLVQETPPKTNPSNICLYDKNTEITIPNTLVKVYKERKDGSRVSLSGNRLMVLRPIQNNGQFNTTMEAKAPNMAYENTTYYTDEEGVIPINLLPNETYYFVCHADNYEKVEKVLVTQSNETAKDWSFCLPLEPSKPEVITEAPPAVRISPPVTREIIYENNTVPLSIGSSFVLENIYYDFNDYHLRPEAKTSLDKLVNLLYNYPSLEIELSAHTDSRGGAGANQRLSQKRADYVVRYLKAKGISEYRLRPVGYGETVLRNDCSDGVDCDKEEHQFNRRTEVKILKFAGSNYSDF